MKHNQACTSVGLALSTAQGETPGQIRYQTQLVFPADVHRPGVTQPLFSTSCVKIRQGCSVTS